MKLESTNCLEMFFLNKNKNNSKFQQQSLDLSFTNIRNQTFKVRQTNSTHPLCINIPVSSNEFGNRKNKTKKIDWQIANLQTLMEECYGLQFQNTLIYKKDKIISGETSNF